MRIIYYNAIIGLILIFVGCGYSSKIHSDPVSVRKNANYEAGKSDWMDGGGIAAKSNLDIVQAIGGVGTSGPGSSNESPGGLALKNGKKGFRVFTIDTNKLKNSNVETFNYSSLQDTSLILFPIADSNGKQVVSTMIMRKTKGKFETVSISKYLGEANDFQRSYSDEVTKDPLASYDLLAIDQLGIVCLLIRKGEATAVIPAGLPNDRFGKIGIKTDLNSFLDGVRSELKLMPPSE